MKWLPAPDEFRARLASIQSRGNALERLEELSALANTRLSYLETMQTDAALQRVEQVADTRFDRLRLAILAGSTVDHLLPSIRVAGLRRGLHFQTYAGRYRQYRQELLDSKSQLFDFRPDIVLFSFVANEFLGATPIGVSAEEADHVIDTTVQDLRGMWNRAKDSLRALVIQQSLLDVEPPLFGAFDATVPGAPARLVARLNAALADAACTDGILWLDITRASARDGLDKWFDAVRWIHAKMEIGPMAAPLYGDLVARLIAAARGKSRKCLVLDLDNTLWGGVVGDDGVEGIVLGQDGGLGEAHLALQRYAKTLMDRGVILSVCSKNDPAIAEAAFDTRPEMLLKRSDFAAFQANWSDKVTNLEIIAGQLNIGLDSLVFVDDNPVERAFVRTRLPMVAVPELPSDPAHFVPCIAEAGYFESIAFSREDRERSTLYSANKQRARLQSAAGGMDAFLEQLGMSVDFGPVSPLNIARVTQLINKTNQFNTTTMRLTENEVTAFAAVPGAILLQFRLLDKFGDNGLVSVMIVMPVEDEPGVLDMIVWVMSCRVFGRQLEHEALNIVVEMARYNGARTLRATFKPTAKNAVIKDMFAKLGFFRDDEIEQADHSSRWILPLDDYIPHPTHIARNEQAHD
jgi:FkbH-like protein